MTSVLLDTGVLLALVRQSPAAHDACLAAGLYGGPAEGYTTAVNAGELLAISERNEWGSEKLRILEDLFEEFPVLERITPQIYRAYALIQCWTQGTSVEAPGDAPPPKPSRPIGQNDLWIAATAHADGSALLTADEDFLPFDGIWFPVLHCRLRSEASGRTGRP